MPKRGTFAISAPSVFDGAQFLPDHCVIVRSGRVTQLLPAAQCPQGLPCTQLEQGTLAPGFIDLQVNGGGDLLFNNDPDAATLEVMLAAHRASGTTAMLPTLISDTPARREQAVAAVRAAGSNPGILGIHLEGPYFAAARRGAHQAAMIETPAAADIDWLCALTDLKVIVTLAPEVTAPGQIRQLCASGIHVCAGHTDATYRQMADAIDEGMEGVTHLFNAMSGPAAREPGAAGTALAEDSLWAGIIADGHHVHPANIRLAQRSKPAGQLLLVSDAMATVGGSRGQFSLYGETISERGGKLVNSSGALAGSAIGMIDAVGYANRAAGIELAECLRMASRYPAAVLGLEAQLGRVAEGYRADLVHFDDQFRVHNTWLAGDHRQHG